VRSQAKVYVESPSYLGSLNIFQSVGAQLCPVPMDASGIIPWGSKEMQSGGAHSLLYTIPTFQNPTGCVMPVKRRQEVLQYCTERHIPIIEDDVFRDLWLDETPPPPMKPFDRCGSVVYTSTLSKCFSPGFRLGWLVGPEAIVQRLADVKMQMDYGVSVLTQQVAEELFSSGAYEAGVTNIRRELKRRRDLMMQLLERWFSGLADWNCPAGGFFVWVRLRNRVSAESLFNRALSEGLLIMPGGVYDRGHTSSIRLTYGYLSDAEMERGVRRLSEMLRGLKREQN
jgi:GntR family transcriptional regulator of abcA and norABC